MAKYKYRTFALVSTVATVLLAVALAGYGTAVLACIIVVLLLI